MQKEMFTKQRKSKLILWGDGPFQVIGRIIDHAYRLKLPSEYGISATFNNIYLSPFDIGDEQGG